MKIVIEIDEEKDGPDAARQALAGRDFVRAINQAFAEIRSKLKYGSNHAGTEEENEAFWEENEAFCAGLDYGRQVLIDALEERSLLDLVIE